MMQQDIEKKLGSLISLTNDSFNSLDEINIKKLGEAVEKTIKYSRQFNTDQEPATEQQKQHFLHAMQLLQEIINIQQAMISLQIKKIDPTQAGIASAQHKRLQKAYKDAARGIGIGEEEEGIFSDIIKNVFKPFNYVISLLRTFTPDNWRIASTKQRVYAILGGLLVLTGLAFVVAAVVFGVAAPLTAAMGIGASVVYGSVVLGLAAAVSLGIGGAFLDNVKKSLSKKLDQKDHLMRMQQDCDACLELTKDTVLKKTKQPTNEPIKPRRFMEFFIKPDKEPASPSDSLLALSTQIQSIETKLKNRPVH